MTYVPTPPATSGHAKALTDRITEAVTEYRRENPRASDADVAEALKLAKTRVNARGSGASTAAVIGGLVALLLGGVFFYLRQG